MRYIPRIVDEQLSELLDSIPIVTLEGARATGKTTTAGRVVASELRLPRDLELLQSDPRGVLRRLEAPVLIDEWQLAGVDVLWALKEIVDESPIPGSFVLTGSVQPESYGPTYPLTGRGARLLMHPMNQRELHGHGHSSLWISRLLAGEFFVASPSAGPEAGFEVLFESGFPATRDLDPARWLEAYARSVAERSVEVRRDPERVGRLLRVLAELESAAIPDERIIELADINRATFVAYDQMLQRAHVAVPTPAWQTKRLKRLTDFPKRYLVDQALALAIAGLTDEQLVMDPKLAGAYFESFVAAQLRPEVAALGGSMYHLRTKAGEREVDLVLDIGGDLVLCEVKATVRPSARDVKHLQWARTELGSRVAAAVLFHRGSSSLELSVGVWALPISLLWS